MSEERDQLEALGDQVRAATEAAERLVRETAAAMAGDGGRVSDIPAAGWSVRDEGAAGAASSELHLLADLVHGARELLPDELREQLTEVIRQLLILMRAVIDLVVERLEQDSRGHEVEVEDIPIS